MKEQLKKLNELEINLNLFYAVSFGEHGISLQGHAEQETIKQSNKLVSLEFIKEHILLTGSENGINITLTF
jgi:hypothetical protein